MWFLTERIQICKYVNSIASDVEWGYKSLEQCYNIFEANTNDFG